MDVIMSIKKEYCSLILNQEKEFEFRPRLPKNLPINTIYVYEMKPTSALKYIMTVGTPIIYPDKINNNNSYGVINFNSGETKNKVAYPILSMFELKEPLSKELLFNKFWMVPPQSYVYIDTYLELKKEIEQSELKKIF